ncbi:MAG: helix-turn-helix domain-containing protein [Firmicutes bacterium]|nr:helix-turn-helix domain-containing protein [Bacillota bacterium]
MKKYIDEIKDILSVYSHSTNIACRAMKVKEMELIDCPDYNTTAEFCRLVHSSGGAKDECLKSYLYGGRQAEKLGEVYIYFCPYGLVNWVVPLLLNNKMEYFIIGGPTLIHPVDGLLLEDIFKQNPSLKDKAGLVREKLNKLLYVDPVRTRYLAELLMRLSKSQQDFTILEEKKKKNTMSMHFAETIHELKDENKLDKKRYPIEKENDLILKVKSGDREGARFILNQLLGHIYFNNGNNFTIVRAKTIELMALLARAAIEIGADLEIIFGLEYILYEKLNEVRDINELSEWLAEILDRFIEATFVINNVKNKDIIYRAVNYIRNNYYNKKITLNDVAEEIGLSPSYFSKLFKEELNLSYTEYLNKVRIAASKELLREDHPLAEIAQSVGFNDQSYFSKVFKRIEGIPPGKWRE